MLKIETSSPTPDLLTVILSGRVERDHLAELERLVCEAQAAHRRISFDLKGVSLFDRDAVDFFATGSASAAHLLSCPSYLRAWLDTVRRGARETTALRESTAAGRSRSLAGPSNRS